MLALDSKSEIGSIKFGKDLASFKSSLLILLYLLHYCIHVFVFLKINARIWDRSYTHLPILIQSQDGLPSHKYFYFFLEIHIYFFEYQVIELYIQKQVIMKQDTTLKVEWWNLLFYIKDNALLLTFF